MISPRQLWRVKKVQLTGNNFTQKGLHDLTRRLGDVEDKKVTIESRIRSDFQYRIWLVDHIRFVWLNGSMKWSNLIIDGDQIRIVWWNVLILVIRSNSPISILILILIIRCFIIQYRLWPRWTCLTVNWTTKHWEGKYSFVCQLNDN